MCIRIAEWNALNFLIILTNIVEYATLTQYAFSLKYAKEEQKKIEINETSNFNKSMLYKNPGLEISCIFKLSKTSRVTYYTITI